MQRTSSNCYRGKKENPETKKIVSTASFGKKTLKTNYLTSILRETMVKKYVVTIFMKMLSMLWRREAHLFLVDEEEEEEEGKGHVHQLLVDVS